MEFKNKLISTPKILKSVNTRDLYAVRENAHYEKCYTYISAVFPKTHLYFNSIFHELPEVLHYDKDTLRYFNLVNAGSCENIYLLSR